MKNLKLINNYTAHATKTTSQNQSYSSYAYPKNKEAINLQRQFQLITQSHQNDSLKVNSKDLWKRNALSQSPKKNINDISFLPLQRKTERDTKTLVCDLDETLVHSSFDVIDNPDILIPISLDEEECNIYVSVRPGAYEFLEELSQYYEIVIFTASLAKYADPLIERLDHKKLCKHRLFREHCTLMDGAYIKDMTKMGRNIKNIIVLDNSAISYSFQPENGVPIKSWYDDTCDIELYKLLPILKNLSGFYDVRTEIQKFVVNNTFIWKRAVEWLKENLLIESLLFDIEEVIYIEFQLSNNYKLKLLGEKEFDDTIVYESNIPETKTNYQKEKYENKIPNSLQKKKRKLKDIPTNSKQSPQENGQQQISININGNNNKIYLYNNNRSNENNNDKRRNRIQQSLLKESMILQDNRNIAPPGTEQSTPKKKITLHDSKLRNATKENIRIQDDEIFSTDYERLQTDFDSQEKMVCSFDNLMSKSSSNNACIPKKSRINVDKSIDIHKIANASYFQFTNQVKKNMKRNSYLNSIDGNALNHTQHSISKNQNSSLSKINNKSTKSLKSKINDTNSLNYLKLKEEELKKSLDQLKQKEVNIQNINSISKILIKPSSNIKSKLQEMRKLYSQKRRTCQSSQSNSSNNFKRNDSRDFANHNPLISKKSQMNTSNIINEVGGINCISHVKPKLNTSASKNLLSNVEKLKTTNQTGNYLHYPQDSSSTKKNISEGKNKCTNKIS